MIPTHLSSEIIGLPFQKVNSVLLVETITESNPSILFAKSAIDLSRFNVC
jgi:hypothetical protein